MMSSAADWIENYDDASVRNLFIDIQNQLCTAGSQACIRLDAACDQGFLKDFNEEGVTVMAQEMKI